jgi:hypothetical protein
MRKSAVEFLEQICKDRGYHLMSEYIEQAKEIEKKEKLKHQLFIGKVSEIIGSRKTVELLKEVNNEIK